MPRTLTGRAAFAISVIAALVLLALPASAQPAAPTATPHSLAGCFGHSGVQYSTKLSYMCVGSIPSGGILYWAQWLYVFEYYWHPANGGMVVTEVYYKPPGSVWLGEEPLVTPLGLPLPPASDGRIITLADGCLVAAPSDTGPPPTTCTSTSQGGQPGATHAMTTAEQNSVDGFWVIMDKFTPDNAW